MYVSSLLIYYCAAGINGTDGLPGPKGPTGPPGELGDKGEKGAIGRTGFPGKIGPKGSAGRNGGDGIPGTPGINGTIGPNVCCSFTYTGVYSTTVMHSDVCVWFIQTCMLFSFARVAKVKLVKREILVQKETQCVSYFYPHTQIGICLSLLLCTCDSEGR